MDLQHIARIKLDLPEANLFLMKIWLPLIRNLDGNVGNSNMQGKYLVRGAQKGLLNWDVSWKACLDQDHRWHWTYYCEKQIQATKAYPSSGEKYGSKIDPSIKNVRTLSYFMHAIKKDILLHLQN